MSRTLRKQLFSIEDLLEKANKVLEKRLFASVIDEDALIELISDCQNSAISMGEQIEKLYGEGTKCVALLEQYCEDLYLMTQYFNDTNKKREIYNSLNKQLKKLRGFMTSELPDKLEVVFFPYKASMWDSLESVYLAAKEDAECDAYCVPIPYYDRNQDGSLGQMHYEGKKYPENIEVVDWQAYNVEERRPDAIYIHNPYDDWNRVTCVHPHYFSKNLRKYTENLIYIPYFATTGGMNEWQSLCPAYVYADYIVIQSEKYRKYYDTQIDDAKFLTFGSPKFDSIINKCKNPPLPPKEWQEMMKDKKVYFYNTSIGGMLADTENFLRKMEYVFETFREREDACLLWRPHPLLESTFESMRKEYKPIYDVLKQKFILEKLGIYDTSSDMENSITMSDAYIGDSGTSVTSLFGVVGKPIFILNNKIHRLPQEDDWKNEIIKAPYSGNNKWCVTQGNKLYCSLNDDYNYKYYCDLSEYAGGNYYNVAVPYREEVYVCPANAQHLLRVSKDKQIQRIELIQASEQPGAFVDAIQMEKYLILLPKKYPAMVIFNMETCQVNYLHDAKEVYQQSVNGNLQFGAVGVQDNKIIVASPDGKKIVRINPEDMTVEAIKTEIEGGILAFVAEGDRLWCVPQEGTIVSCYDMKTKETEHFDLMLAGLSGLQRPQMIETNQRIYGKPALTEKYVIFPPCWGNKFACINRETKEITEWENPIKISNGEYDNYVPAGSVGYFMYPPKENRYKYFSNIERKIYDIDIETKEYETIEIRFNREELEKHDSGFSEVSQWMQYCCYENAFHSLRDFLDDKLIGNPHNEEKQLKAFSKINVSMDGKCGQKVHRYIKRK